MQNRVGVRVRRTDVAAASATASGERTSPRTAARDHPRGNPRRATRLYPHPGRRGARHQPLHVQPSRPSLRRHRRDALGRTPDPGRRARTPARRMAPGTAQATGSLSAGRSAFGRSARDRRAHPRPARRRKEPRADRPRSQRRRDAYSTRWRTLVAFHRAFCPLAIVHAGVIRPPSRPATQNWCTFVALGRSLLMHDFSRCRPASLSIPRASAWSAAESTHSPPRSLLRSSCRAADEGRTALRPRGDSPGTLEVSRGSGERSLRSSPLFRVSLPNRRPLSSHPSAWPDSPRATRLHRA